MENKISIIVPCYKQAQYLDECLQSVLKQTYQNWECIIVNDGSPDNTEEVAQKWIERDKRFSLLNIENGGVSRARNKGIEAAKGEWILPLDADDKIGEKYLELAEKEFNKADLIYANSSFFGTVNKIWNIHYTSYQDLLINNKIYCSALYKKKDWANINGYDENLLSGFEDWEFYIRLLDDSKNVIKIIYEGFFYRRKDVSRDININKNIGLQENVKKYIFKKNIDKYLQYFPSVQTLVSEKTNIGHKYENAEKKLSTIKQELNKNIITKILYRIILIFS
ncbi:glycosyltransferase family 2 protein [Chryseobacterium manosquense]|uniref:Glycosyltransferase 2-like domain-containing protein n=2 Tax=Chryseobacterium group TaxID=2782232 RepID=A0A246B6U1_9FLAO|nr:MULTISPECIES: glycosyltransferase family A protein [Chryseobacterium group]OWK97106.1 hypothetical protein AP75_12995 [Kaistella haifensis DSM 19056]QNS40618.1 glycosyltransferase family 2 protein [Chryseobacterium manosquense]